jgi:hypothetical protein
MKTQTENKKTFKKGDIVGTKYGNILVEEFVPEYKIGNSGISRPAQIKFFDMGFPCIMEASEAV